jgi:hypothetical protein
LHARNLHAREPGDPTIARCRDQAAGRSGKTVSRTPEMGERGKSDSPVVPARASNNAAHAVAEAVEERGLAKGNAASKTRPGPRTGKDASNALARVRQAARQDSKQRFTALLHHVSVDRLRAAYRAINPKAAVGVDAVTWQDYGQDLEANLQDLWGRAQRGSYRAKPTRRASIPKADGRLRPLGVAALEDKIVQRGVVEVLGAVYEMDFLGFSYGFCDRDAAHMMRWTRWRSGSNGRR